MTKIKAKASLHKGKNNTGREGVYLQIEANKKMKDSNFIGNQTWHKLIYIADGIGQSKKERMKVLRKFKDELEEQEENYNFTLTNRLKKLKENL